MRSKHPLARRDEDHGKVALERLVELAHDLETVRGPRKLDLDDGQRRAVRPEPLDQLVARRRRARVIAQPDGHLDRRQARPSSESTIKIVPQSFIPVLPSLSRCGSCAGNRWKSSLALGRRRS